MRLSRKVVVHVANDVLANIERMAEESFPNESGGALMGYWSEEEKTVVITNVVGPGPNAKHARYSFVPDYEFQEQQIAEIYSTSGRLRTYLGDWHSHPDGPASLSNTDKRTLKNIADFPKARAEKPLMILLSGVPAKWKRNAWILKSRLCAAEFA